MPRFPFFLTTFGDPRAEKRALLLHGLMGTGIVWYKVANLLVDAGYRVDCPDLMGHGFGPASENYDMTEFAKHLAKYLRDSYEVVAGVSFGSPIATHLYPLLEHKPKRLVLIEPGMDITPWPTELADKMAGFIKEPLSEKEIEEMQPTWEKEEIAFRKLAMLQTDQKVIYDLFKQVAPHSILPSAEQAKGTEIIILAADQAKGAVYPIKHAELLEKSYPHVKLAMIKGAAHDVHKGRPDVAAKVMLEGLKPSQDLDILRA